ncbi:MAG: hypothetical protein N4A57_09380 [Anaeromicrobium sp.]|jgi:hypothetical protein|uniref:hypothetical protein n=1 Tax=Anaeromicrobium sp. TaxID=1929132 RepID=UPI0025F66A44|nr:hypothetical protein [Anaeromicrobium sp.]MCT4594464.1 hypothetical protein [Anaeromicrobium sp.]
MAKAKALKSSMQKMIFKMLDIFSKEEIEKIAREVGFVKRKGKIEPWQFLYLCAFSDLDICKDTLVTMSSNMGSNLDNIVSTQAIHERLNYKAVAFLQEIFVTLLNKSTKGHSNIPSMLDEHFKRIRIVDSTAFQVPEIYKDEYKGSGGSS